MKAVLILSCLSASLISCTTISKFIGQDSSHQNSQMSERSFASSPRGDGADVIDSMYSSNEELTAAAEQEENEDSLAMNDSALESSEQSLAPESSYSAPEANYAAAESTFAAESEEASASTAEHVEPLGDPSFAQSEVAEATHVEDFMVAPIETPEVATLDIQREQERVMAPKKIVKKSYKKSKKVVKKSKKSKKAIAKKKSKKSKSIAKKNSKKSKKYVKNSKKNKKSKLAKNKKKSKKVASKSKKKRNVAASKKGYKVSKK